MSVFSSIQNVVVVTLIAALVWLYAEGRAIRTSEDRSVRVVFTAPVNRADELAITPREPVDFDVTVIGSSSQLSSFEQLTTNRPIQIEVDEQVQSPLNMLEALEQSQVGELGVNLQDVIPAQIDISVERIDQVEMPVRVLAGDVQLTTNTSVSPDRVSVRLPQRLTQFATDQHALAMIPQERIAQSPVGVPQTVDVRLQLPVELRSAWSTVVPENVSVTYTVRKLHDTYRVESLGVRISVPPSLLQQWNFELDDRNRVLESVELAGPSDTIAAIRDGRQEVFAEVRPRSNDLKEGTAKLTVYIQTPPGVTVTSPAQTVDVKITPRQPPEP